MYIFRVKICADRGNTNPQQTRQPCTNLLHNPRCSEATSSYTRPSRLPQQTTWRSIRIQPLADKSRPQSTSPIPRQQQTSNQLQAPLSVTQECMQGLQSLASFKIAFMLVILLLYNHLLFNPSCSQTHHHICNFSQYQKKSIKARPRFSSIL